MANYKLTPRPSRLQNGKKHTFTRKIFRNLNSNTTGCSENVIIRVPSFRAGGFFGGTHTTIQITQNRMVGKSEFNFTEKNTILTMYLIDEVFEEHNIPIKPNLFFPIVRPNNVNKFISISITPIITSLYFNYLKINIQNYS